MRIDAAKNHIDFEAWTNSGSPRVRLRIGWQRYTATPAEALEFARQLVKAAEAVCHADND